MSKETVKTGSGQEVTGEVVRCERSGLSLAESLVAIATLGFSEIGSKPKTTVKDDSGHYHTGTKK